MKRCRFNFGMTDTLTLEHCSNGAKGFGYCNVKGD